MVKSFLGLTVANVEKSINKFLKDNPGLEIVSISLANVVKSGPAWNQWAAIVALKGK